MEFGSLPPLTATSRAGTGWFDDGNFSHPSTELIQIASELCRSTKERPELNVTWPLDGTTLEDFLVKTLSCFSGHA
eukprot:scaffold145939_cov14-Tisochrysis_lutea.AAC.1